MKKIFTMAVAALLLAGPTSCSYDDSDLWTAVDDVKDRVDALEAAVSGVNGNLSALQTIVEALRNNVTVTEVTPTAEGYVIKFSNGETATITNGRDGVDAPEITVAKDSDGYYYWKIDGQWLTVDGERVKANGADGVAPKMRINEQTGEWEISTDDGLTWTSTGVVAAGTSGDSMFETVDTTDPSCVKFVLADGTELSVPRFDSEAPLFAVKDCDGVQVIRNGESATFAVTTANIADYTIQKPDGWRVEFDGKTLKITSPAEANTYAEQEGAVSIVVVSTAGRSMIVKIEVATYELRVLTFEDADAKFTPYTLNYCNKSISTWSDLIDERQYGGPMLYGDSGYGMDSPYQWYDEKNTELRHTMPPAYGMYCYWSGGHAISNFYDMDLSNGDFTHQLSVYAASGHNGSTNFAMHFGYIDDSPYGTKEALPALEFGDGAERIIDHLYIMNSTYAMNCYISGNGLTAKIGPDDWVKLLAIGYDKSGAKTGEVTFYTCNGPEDIVMDWTKWDLTSLGKVAKVEFNITGSSDNGYGFSQPAYFAYDDVAVRF